jgi:hypothetical protein
MSRISARRSASRRPWTWNFLARIIPLIEALPQSASVLNSPVAKGTHYVYDLITNEPCPRCGKTIRQTTIDLHPTRASLAIHNFECVDCGLVKLKPGKSPPELAA